MDGFDSKLKGMKEQRAKIKAEAKKRRGEPVRPVYVQPKSKHARQLGRSGSVSSSDIEDLADDARRKERRAEQGNVEGGKDEEESQKRQDEARVAEGKAEAAQDA